ncbi:hypothetical protein TNCV_2757062 [Trichonephila clavipes]|nr:hypothetical protein TNCV_2757062 [Trichonephila clavipes]
MFSPLSGKTELGDLCKTRFKVLRDRYPKEKARVLPSGSEAKARKLWPFSEMLSFLDPYMQKGSTCFNLPETFVLTPSTSRKPTPNLKKRKRAREDLIDTALMKIGGETDPKDLLLALKNIRQK